MILILIIVLLFIGCFEIWVFNQSAQEEDFLLIWVCFISALFLGAVKIGGAW